MSIENDLLELEEIVTELIDVGETLADLSLIRFELVNDTHWDSLDMTLFIFGAGDCDQGSGFSPNPGFQNTPLLSLCVPIHFDI